MIYKDINFIGAKQITGDVGIIMNTIKIAFIKAGWHKEIVHNALVGFEKELADQSVDAELKVLEVPGAFEMPLLAKRLAETGKYDAIVCAALVVDGGIYRHDFVAAAVVDGLMNVQLSTNVPVYSVSLTPHNFQPVDVIENFYTEHFIKKGKEAARAALAIHNLSID
jgi:6,7-dimethyl-8-ribityllumazine synthase